MVYVTSSPPGARVYNARGVTECGSALRGYRPYDHVQGTYRGNTPVIYSAGFYAYDNVRVVWPDGEDSGWSQQPTGYRADGAFHFTKKNTVGDLSILRERGDITGCITTNMIHVTSDPPGAKIYNARTVEDCGTISRGYRPYDHVSGAYRGETPATYIAGFYAYENVRVVWPDGEGSGWQQQRSGFGSKDCSFHFVKSNTTTAHLAAVSGVNQPSLPTLATTTERLAILKALRAQGDITDDEYRQRRIDLLDSISSKQPQSIGSSRAFGREAMRVPAADRERMEGAQAIAKSSSRFTISVHIEDDPAQGGAILGNGDGLIQKGEAFDLVVVISNVSTSAMKDVTCTVTLPPDKSLKAYSELHYAVSQLEPAVAATNRIHLAIPMNITTSTVPTCIIMVKEAGDAVEERLNYELPMDLELTRR